MTGSNKEFSDKKRCACGECNEYVSGFWYDSRKHRKAIRRFKPGHNLMVLTKAHNKGRFGSQSFSWNGGCYMTHGYVMVYAKDHPRVKSRPYVFEHILVMEQYLGRYLLPGEIVHHVNGDTSDNRIDNLQLFNSHSEHQTFHQMKDMSNRICLDCGTTKSIRRQWYYANDKGDFICRNCYRRRKKKT